jgi:hypothetical protein
MVAQHLQGEDGDNAKVPKLKRLLVWTDGHSSTYKGFPNFGRMGYWPLAKPSSPSEATVVKINLSLHLASEICVDRKLFVLSLDGEAAQQVQQATSAHTGVGAEVAPEIAIVDPRKLKVSELRAELQKLGFSTTGLKAALVKRLSDALGTSGSKCFRVMSVEGAKVESVEAYQAALRACIGAVATVCLIEVRYFRLPPPASFELPLSSSTRSPEASRMQLALKSTTASSSLTMRLEFRTARGRSLASP